MLIAKCEECGYVERVPDNYAGCDLECPCGRTVHVPSKFKVKQTSISPKQVQKQKFPFNRVASQKEFGRIEFFLHILASIGVGLVFTLIFGPGPNFFTILSTIGLSVWQVIVVQKRLDDSGLGQPHIIPIVALSIYGILLQLYYPISTTINENPIFAGTLICFAVWGFGVFIACLFTPGKHTWK